MWKAGRQQFLFRAVLAGAVVGAVLVSQPSSEASVVAGVTTGALVWAPTAILLALDLGTSRPPEHWLHLATPGPALLPGG